MDLRFGINLTTWNSGSESPQLCMNTVLDNHRQFISSIRTHLSESLAATDLYISEYGAPLVKDERDIQFVGDAFYQSLNDDIPENLSGSQNVRLILIGKTLSVGSTQKENAVLRYVVRVKVKVSVHSMLKIV